MRSLRATIMLVFMMVASIGCKERFDPKLPASQSNILVVEGFINANGFTTIRLTRTVPLKDTAKIKPELNAQVTIIGKDNSTYNVRAKGGGIYTSDSLVLNTSQKYRIRIRTSSGGDYLSEYAVVKQTPAIDSVSWKIQDNGSVRIFVDTHDQQNNTRYYKWDYEETWEINSAFGNYVEYKNGAIRTRAIDEVSKLYYCWRTQNSTSILLGSSASLTNDVISLAPIHLIAANSERISVRYSILVKQYSLDRKAYDFYQMMKSNTESLGSVFDPLPSEVTGNISCVSNPSEKVIGYVTASTVDQKRIFILRSDVPSRYSDNCETTYVTLDSIKYYFDTGGLLPYQADFGRGGGVQGYFSSYPDCIDCTLRGSNVKPSFW